MARVKEAATLEEQRGAIGDLLFVLVNFSVPSCDSEEALSLSNKKFKGRFAFIEECQERPKKPKSYFDENANALQSRKQEKGIRCAE